MKVNHRKLGKAKADSGTHKIKPYQDPYASKRKGAKVEPAARTHRDIQQNEKLLQRQNRELILKNEEAISRVATLKTENDALRKRNAELLEHNKRFITEAVKK